MCLILLEKYRFEGKIGAVGDKMISEGFPYNENDLYNRLKNG